MNISVELKHQFVHSMQILFIPNIECVNCNSIKEETQKIYDKIISPYVGDDVNIEEYLVAVQNKKLYQKIAVLYRLLQENAPSEFSCVVNDIAGGYCHLLSPKMQIDKTFEVLAKSQMKIYESLIKVLPKESNIQGVIRLRQREILRNTLRKKVLQRKTKKVQETIHKPQQQPVQEMIQPPNINDHFVEVKGVTEDDECPVLV